MSAERYIPYEAPQSLWSMIELYAPTVELPEIKYIIGEDLIEQSFELFDEIDCLLEVWRSTVPKEVPVKISGRNIPESLHVRNNVLMKIRQFIDQLDETKNHLLKGFLDDRKVICNYAIKQSSIPATAISTDGRLTPSRKLSKNHHIDTPDISAYRDSLSAFEVEKIVGDIRFSFLEEQALLRKDIDFLQDAIANEHERTSGALERQPSLCELKTFADELEQKLIDIAQPAFANVQNVKPNLPKLKSIPSNEPSSSHLSSPPLPIIPSRPQKSPNGNSSRSSWRQRTLKKVDIPVTPSNSLLRELRLKSNRSAVNKEKLLIPHPPPVRRTAFELQNNGFMGGKSRKDDDDQNVKVAVRCRPLNEDEAAMNATEIVKVFPEHGSIILMGKKKGDLQKKFTFDNVFGPDSKQLDLYNICARKIVDSVLEGYNGTIFAYGQTGTGKTFTMEGVRSIPEMKGIIPNSFAHIFGEISKSGGDVKFLVRVSYLEIYNEDIRDLLSKDQKKKLEVKERPDVGVYVRDLHQFSVKNAEDMDKIMTVGNKNRSVGATKMNSHSSRSHAIFSITIERYDQGMDGKGHLRMGKLHLVDLAGSERQTKTGATGDRLKEATKINLSLSTLGNVISALVDGKISHIPYRDSKLTRLLQDSLGGNSKTVMLANINPASYNADETLATLRYANRAKNIKNKAHINEDPKDAMLREFQKEIEALKRQLAEDGGPTNMSGESEEVTDEEGNKIRVKRKKKKRLSMNDAEISAIKAQLEKEKKELLDAKSIEANAKEKISKELEKREKELLKTQEEKKKLSEKLSLLEGKLIVGGVDLLEKAKKQQDLLEKSFKELETHAQTQQQIKEEIEEREQEKLLVEEQYASLQDEAVGKTKKLAKINQMYKSAKAEIADMEEEHRRRVESLADDIRQLNKELQLQTLLINHTIPIEFQELIEKHIMWNEDLGEWQLHYVAYTGNNMRQRTPTPPPQMFEKFDMELELVYWTYGPLKPQPTKKKKKKKRVKNKDSSSTVTESKSDFIPPSRPKTAMKR